MKTEYKVVTLDGDTYWYLDGKLHRTDGPAIEYADGGKSWYLDDKQHRTDGPAAEWADGTKLWYIDDKLHRTDGPAAECADGTKYWYLDDKALTESKFLARIKKSQNSCDGKVVEIEGRKYRLVRTR